ncbi:MAG TPA: TatD family hydrolase [Candidatus Omnitrophota bacterium]|nr:TatD family hydrolase [Candidatus Omnitrophota bacterium]HRY85111.1 TatD family hydrolase [Candidatus Omnitrophota bacterium]
MLLDAHLHFQDIRDKGVLAEILSRAWDFGLGQFWCNAVRPEDWAFSEKLAGVDERVIPFWGVHPWYAEKAGKGWEKELESLLKHRKAGVGEVGLDKARVDNGLEAQTRIFQRQLRLAVRLSRPVAIHCVQAWGDLLKALRDFPEGSLRFMVHSYHGPSEILRELLGLGGFISFSWKWLRGGTPDMMALIRQVPLDRLLLETDFPYTEPGKIGATVTADQYFECIRGVYQIAARAKGIEESELEKAVSENGKAFLSGTPARQGEG